MSHRPRERCAAPKRREDAASSDIARESLGYLASILVHCGIPPSELPPIVETVCRKLKPVKQSWNPADLAYISDLPHVVAHWHSDSNYLDDKGEPCSLRFAGASPSLSELISRVYPECDPAAVRDALLRTGVIRRSRHLFRPVRRTVVFRSRAAGRLHALNSLLGLLRTVEHNLANGRRDLLIELSASNPSIPISQFRDLRLRVNERGAEFLTEMDAHMSRLEGQRKPAATTRRVGIGVFMYTSPVRKANESVASSRRSGKP